MEQRIYFSKQIIQISQNQHDKFIKLCLKKIKFWNLLKGKVTQIYDDPMGTKMTAIAVDKPCKRAYLGIIQENYEI